MVRFIIKILQVEHFEHYGTRGIAIVHQRSRFWFKPWLVAIATTLVDLTAGSKNHKAFSQSWSIRLSDYFNIFDEQHKIL